MIRPKKSLGQNFLIDKNISIKIVKLIKNIEKKNIIEVGPGKGALTDIIIQSNPKKFILIEKDKQLYLELLEKYKSYNNVKIINKDAINFDFSKINNPKTIIANLPYNISIKLVINWLKEINNFHEIVVMLQKEVAYKMNYKKNIKRNRLNVLTEMTSDFSIEFNVSRNVFYPKPKIDSTVVKITPKYKNIYDFAKIENFTRILFRNKRKKINNVLPKMILNNLKKNLEYNNANFILQSRAEDLNIKNILYLFNKF